MAGLVIGSVVGALVAPPLTRALSPQPGGANQPLIAAGIFLACLLIIQGIGTAVGFRARMAAMRTRFATWDSVAGTVAGGFGVLFAAWFLGFTFADSSLTIISQQVSGSAIEHGLQDVAPRPPAFLAQVQQFLGADFPAMAKLLASFPQLVPVFTNVPPGLDVYKPLVTTMQENVHNYAQIDSLPNFNLFTWFFVIPGILLVLLAASGLGVFGVFRRRSPGA